MAPCVLCWYQRIAMFPLVVVLGIGVLRQDHAMALPALVLAAAGWFVAGYHTLLYWGWIDSGHHALRLGVLRASRLYCRFWGHVRPALCFVAGFHGDRAGPGRFTEREQACLTQRGLR
jgi:disulfide bond formation protein DsbB